LAYTLEDPYAAVRSIAHRSLSHLPGFEAFPYDFESSAEHQRESRDKALALWRSAANALPESQQTLTGPGPLINTDGISQLLDHRDNRPMHLRE
jgi:hypothetical protein